MRATGAVIGREVHALAGVYGQGQDEGLHLLAEALARVGTSGGTRTKLSCIGCAGHCYCGRPSRIPHRRKPASSRLLDVSRRQQATWELRAAMSLARLWQEQGSAPQPASCWP